MARRASRILPAGTRAPRFTLPDTVSGRSVSLESYADSAAVLVAFICNHCPFVKHILDGFVAFARDFDDRGLAVIAISSNDVESYPQDSPAEMARLAALKDFIFPYLYDESQAVALAYEAVCTPDFYLFDRNRQLVYHGQFDASRPGNGVPVTGRDLRAACEALLSGAPMPREQVASVGCSIKWRADRAPEWA
ncbi:MAG: thioredoxin family protein [Gammaproteobacteria bacterium]|nr:thioredoxin family protein [Gammaproteobacteria bacterium]